MSLWNKSLNDVSFADIDDFCKLQFSEGVQLDYKQAIPNDLEKTVSAFANTRGGLLLLGVKADKQTNKPIDWPCKGMEARDGLSEQIMQICRDRIYPPILPECSPPITDPNNSGHVFIVVRVDESSRVPHSIKNKTKVYTRTGEANHPIELANIERIEQLLNRRKTPDKFRDKLIDRHINRVFQRHPGRREPTVWFCVIPEFPEVPIFSLEDCREAVLEGGLLRVLDGWIHFREIPDYKDTIYSSAGKYGELFWSRAFGSETIDAMFIANSLYKFALHAQAMYSRHAIIHPGLTHICVGFANVQGFAFTDRYNKIYECFDNELRFDSTHPFAEIADNKSSFDIIYSIAADIFHAFNAPKPPPRIQWELG